MRFVVEVITIVSGLVGFWEPPAQVVFSLLRVSNSERCEEVMS
jgi:hypothetical protein